MLGKIELWTCIRCFITNENEKTQPDNRDKSGIPSKGFMNASLAIDAQAPASA